MQTSQYGIGKKINLKIIKAIDIREQLDDIEGGGENKGRTR
jgi:hypothetical protein